MSTVLKLTHFELCQRAEVVAQRIQQLFPNGTSVRDPKHHIGIYPVPRGGVSAAYLILRYLDRRFFVTADVTQAEVFVDDLIDSGATRDRYAKDHPTRPFFALYDKLEEHKGLGWVVFPWEGSEEASIEDSTIRLLQFIGEDPTRDGLKETPGRVARAWKMMTQGYKIDVAGLLKTFDGPESYDDMVCVRSIPFYSTCEHHMLPFFGDADVAYIPNGRIVGLSKLSRVVDAYGKRLQVQERMTAEIADALEAFLMPKGVAVRITARHMCMECRGIAKQGHETVTQALRGVFFSNPATRAEFTELVR